MPIFAAIIIVLFSTSPVFALPIGQNLQATIVQSETSSEVVTEYQNGGNTVYIENGRARMLGYGVGSRTF